jgi:hypothetical protein
VVPLTAAGTAPPAPGSTAPPLTPAERVTADRPALERLTAERPAVEPPSFWQGILANLRRHRLLLAGLLALLAAVVAAAVILVPSLTDGDGDGERPTLDRSTVELVVLNASSQTALADKVADSLAIAGFDNVRTGTTGTSRRTVVLYERGNQRAAQQLGRELEVTRVVELDRETRAAAPTDAEVVVVAGEDYARR